MSMSPAICPRCSTPFECGVQTGACWCKEIELNDATRQAFAQYYDGCLCPACLKTLDEGRPPVPSVRAFLASQLKRGRQRPH
jgi:hypothetical protein